MIKKSKYFHTATQGAGASRIKRLKAQVSIKTENRENIIKYQVNINIRSRNCIPENMFLHCDSLLSLHFSGILPGFSREEETVL